MKDNKDYKVVLQMLFDHFSLPNHIIKDDQQIASRNKTQALKEETKIILSNKKKKRLKYKTNKNDGIMIKPNKFILRECKGSALSVRVELIFFKVLLLYTGSFLFLSLVNRRMFHASFHFSQSFFSFPETILLALGTNLHRRFQGRNLEEKSDS